ncbi:MAG: LexA family protein [Synechococcus sp.]
MKNKHGGKRSGAGRPKGTGRKFKEPTVVKRIPQSRVPEVEALISQPQEQLGINSNGPNINVVDIRVAAPSPGKQERPLFASRVPAGFPSPADDYIEMHLDLNEYLVDQPAATYHVQVSGDSMVGAGIMDGDILVVNRSQEAAHNAIVVAIVDGEPTVKRLYWQNSDIELQPENPAYPAIRISAEQDLQIWGVVTGVVRKL